jgi:isomerase DpgB
MRMQIDGSLPLSSETIAVLNAFIDRMEGSGANAAALHLSGAPSAPADNGLDIQVVNKWERVVRRLERVKATTVAVVTGDCGGVAVEALLATDCRLATADARLLMPSVAGVTWPGMGLYRLANQVGPAKIRRIVLFGVPVSAIEAVELNLIDQIIDGEQGTQEGEIALVSGLLNAGAGADLAIRRQLMFDATTTSFEDALGRHLAACDRALRRRTADCAGLELAARPVGHRERDD